MSNPLPYVRGSLALFAVGIIAALDYPVKAGAYIAQGTCVCIDANGLAQPGTAATGLTPVGRAEKTVDNTLGADGAERIEARAGVYEWENDDGIDESDVGSSVYVKDDRTMAISSGGNTRSIGGVVVGMTPGGNPLVATGFYFAASPSAAPSSRFAKKEVTIAYTDFTQDLADGTQTLNVGSALPTAAIPVATQVTIVTEFAGDAAPHMALGVAGGAELAAAFNTAQVAGRYVLASPAAAKTYDGGQLTAKFTPAAGKKLVSDSSAGSLKVDVYYFVAN